MNKAVAVLLVVAGLLAVGCNQPFRAQADFSTTADWAGFERLEVQASNGNVDVRVRAGDQIRVWGTKWACGSTLAEAKQNLDEVTVHAAAAADDADTFLVELRYPPTLRQMSPGARVVVELPQACPATIHTSNGAIRARGLSQEVWLHTHNGRIEAEDIDGALHADSHNGRIEVRGVSGDTHVSTSNGAIDIHDVRGSLEARAGNGSVRVQVTPPADGHVQLRTGNGAIHITIPRDLPADLHLTSNNGRVRTQVEAASLGNSSLSESSTWGVRFEDLAAKMNGGGCRVDATTSNGSVTLKCR